MSDLSNEILLNECAADYSILVDHWYQSSVTGFLVYGLALSLPDQDSGVRLCMGDLGVDVGAVGCVTDFHVERVFLSVGYLIRGAVAW
ncbi:15493_t:CDS:2 [Entrophospora sp. SA101]|nr:15493_t:CDS:2 [Entrophospora sp. SA101]